jgi:hypothetical protein
LYLSYRQNLQHEMLQPQRVNTLELYWQDVTFGGHKWSLTLT